MLAFFEMFVSSYNQSSVASGGVATSFDAGVEVGAGMVVVASESNAFDSALPGWSIATFDSKIKANKSVAKAQVLLSKKSVVFLTPPNCWVPPPPKDEDNPPPFGF